LIEAYLLQLLAQAQAQEIEIRRAELASLFDVVPSQINYVIKTRFSALQGYDVESKRGGGGYIKIVKFHYSARHDFLSQLYQELSENLSATGARDRMQLLFDQNILTEHEGNLLLSILMAEELSDQQRSELMKKILQRLDRDEEDK